MYNPFSFSILFHRHFTFVSTGFLTNFKSFYFVNYSLFGSFSSSFYSKILIRSIFSLNINESPGKIFGKKLYSPKSQMSFNISTDNHVSSSSDEPSGGPLKLKVMNYNVLSQGLLHRHRYLYRNQSDYILRWAYRKERIEKDISSINPDIFCLQEVEEVELPYFFNHLETLGYKSIIKMKTRNKGDGLAIFYRYPSIILKEKHSVEFSQPGIVELESRDNVGLIAKFEKGDKEFIVANTHLLYNPKRTEVRIAQMQIFLAELHRVSRNHKMSRILLMGDLNSHPESPLIKFLMEGQLISQYKPLPPFLGISPGSVHLEDEIKLHHSKVNSPESEVVERYSLKPEPSESSDNSRFHTISHPLNLSSVYDLRPTEKRGVTTYQDGWVMVDYIFYEKGFNLVARLSLPTSSECAQKVRHLPNQFFPSDHLPLAAEFEFL